MSRARCLAVLVASPKLMEVSCATPEQNRIHLPSLGKDMPDRDRLAMRFEQFKARA